MKDFIKTLDEKQLLSYLSKQLDFFFPDGNSNLLELSSIIRKALQRTEFCFSKIKGKYFSNEQTVFFNHLNGDHYCMFLYFASKEAYLMDSENYYLKLSLLNKHLFSIDLFGHIEMPDIFLLVHPVGTIIGRAKIENYFVAYQGVTIGGVGKDNGIQYPIFGEGTVCYSNSSILGDAVIRKNTIIAANTEIIGGNFNENAMILGKYPLIKIKDNTSIATKPFFY
jgi:serine O-acetyltransferase